MISLDVREREEKLPPHFIIKYMTINFGIIMVIKMMDFMEEVVEYFMRKC